MEGFEIEFTGVIVRGVGKPVHHGTGVVLEQSLSVSVLFVTNWTDTTIDEVTTGVTHSVTPHTIVDDGGTEPGHTVVT